MAGITGTAASARIAANIILEMAEWSADFERQTEDDTSFGDTWEEAIATIGKWGATIKGRWGVDGTQQGLLQTGHLAGTVIALRLYVNSTNYYSGNAFVTKISPGATVKGLVEIEYTFQGTGALTYT